MIEKLHGLQATNISLNDRFTLLATSASIDRVPRPRRRSSGMYSFNQNADLLLIDQIAQRLGQQSKRNAVRQRLGLSGLRRSGSEGNLSNLQHSNMFTNLNHNSVKNRVFWQHANGNLRRATSFSSLSHSPWRGFRRRGGRMGLTRGRYRGRGGRQQLVGRFYNQRGRGRGRGGARGAGVGGARGAGVGGAWGAAPARGPRGLRGTTGRGQLQPSKPVPTKEELDLQLDQYMASTKTALDRELDDYMKAAMEEC